MPAISPPKFDGLNVIDTTVDSISADNGGGFGASFAAAAAGSYYIHQHTGSPADTSQLIERFASALNGQAGVSVAVTVDDATGIVTVTNNHGANTLRIRFDDHTGAGVVDVGAMLGLIAVGAAASPIIGPIAAGGGTFAGPTQHYYGWYPDRAPSFVLAPLPNLGARLSNAAVTRAPSGRVVTTKSHELRDNRFDFITLARARVHTDDTITTYTSLEQFFQRILSTGQRFRYYPERDDRNGTTGAGPFEYVAEKETATNLLTAATRTSSVFDELWNISISVHEYVST